MSGLTPVAGRLVDSEIASQEFVQETGQALNDKAGVSAVSAHAASGPRGCRTVQVACQVSYPLPVPHRYTVYRASYVDINERYHQ